MKECALLVKALSQSMVCGEKSFATQDGEVAWR